VQREDAAFPFTAVVSQEQVKIALLLNAVSHEVGGVLIRGQRGTAKSTLARALVDLLPEMEVVADCAFSCDPNDIECLCGNCTEILALEGALPVARTRMKMVTLPLNATEEMVVGTLDIEKALRRGEKGFDPGILARANRSILYVDEVNLLEDHIVDVLLDSAAMGINVVEREGISFRHGAHFILIGTMNPEEGELRPQLEDRFGLCAEVDTEVPLEERTEILRRNLQFRKSPLEFESQWHADQEALRGRIVAARQLYSMVDVPDSILEMVAAVVDRVGADGHRADLAIMNSARAFAALGGETVVGTEHLEKVAGLALNHRLRKGPLAVSNIAQPNIPSLFKEVAGEPRPATGHGYAGTAEAVERPVAGTDERSAPVSKRTERSEKDRRPGEQLEQPRLPERDLTSAVTGKRAQPASQEGRGRYYRSVSPQGSKLPVSASEIAIDATIRASAIRGADPQGKPEVLPEDIKVKLRKRKTGACVVFVVDASASMGARRRLEASREAVLSLLVEAYQKRDRVGLVVFKDDSAQLVLSPTSSPALASRLLSNLEPGGTTPLSHGLSLGLQVLDREVSRSPAPSPVMVLISDCGANVTMGAGSPIAEALGLARDIRSRGIHSVVIDSASGGGAPAAIPGRPTPARRMADAMGGSYFQVRNLTGGVILDKVHLSDPAGTGTASSA
jgi:magnesium chelatase subunit D